MDLLMAGEVGEIGFGPVSALSLRGGLRRFRPAENGAYRSYLRYAVLDGPDHQVGRVATAGLLQNVGPVLVHRPFRYEELVGDFLVGHSPAYQQQYLFLPVRKHVARTFAPGGLEASHEVAQQLLGK